MKDVSLQKKKSLKSEELMWNSQIRIKAGTKTKDWTKTEHSIDKHLICCAKFIPANPLNNNSKGSF